MDVDIKRENFPEEKEIEYTYNNSDFKLDPLDIKPEEEDSKYGIAEEGKPAIGSECITNDELDVPVKNEDFCKVHQSEEDKKVVHLYIINTPSEDILSGENIDENCNSETFNVQIGCNKGTNTICDKGIKNKIRKFRLSKCKPNSCGNCKFDCYICGKIFTLKHNLLRHVKCVHKTNLKSEEKFVCDYCKFHFSRKIDLIYHIKRHLSLFEFVCHLCGDGFIKRCELKRHFVRKHSANKNKCSNNNNNNKNNNNIDCNYKNNVILNCTECGKKFQSKQQLFCHMKNKHRTSAGKYECVTCNKVYRELCQYLKHLEMHEKPRPYICIYCNKTFTLKNSLRDHINMHLNVKRHICNLCNKGFIKMSHLKRHKRRVMPCISISD